MVIDTINVPLSDQMIQEARSLIGTYLRRRRHTETATAFNIAGFQRGIGGRNPLFLQPGYARESFLGTTVAPPCWLYTVDHTGVAPKLPGIHALYAGVDWEFYRWVFEGDTIQVRARLIDVQEKTGRFCGRMVLQVGEVVFVNQRLEPVARALSKTMRVPRKAAVERGKYMHIPSKYRYTEEELRAIEDAYDAEEIRGAIPRYWEDVKVGDPIGPVVKAVLSNEEMGNFVRQTAPVLGSKEFVLYRKRHPYVAFQYPGSGLWEDWRDGLIEETASRLYGFPLAHDAGIDRISWVGDMLTNWMGDQGFLKRLSVDLVAPNFYGDTQWCRGRVVEKLAQDHTVRCEVWCDSQRGERTAHGSAVIVLPSKVL